MCYVLMTYCLRKDVAAGTHVSAVRSASKRRPYLSKSRTGMLRNLATGNKGPRKFCISTLTSGAKKDTWHGALSPPKAMTPRRGQFDGTALTSIFFTSAGNRSRTNFNGTAPSPSDAMARNGTSETASRPKPAMATAPLAFGTFNAVAAPALWPSDPMLPVAPRRFACSNLCGIQPVRRVRDGQHERAVKF